MQPLRAALCRAETLMKIKILAQLRISFSVASNFGTQTGIYNRAMAIYKHFSGTVFCICRDYFNIFTYNMSSMRQTVCLQEGPYLSQIAETRLFGASESLSEFKPINIFGITWIFPSR